MGTSQLWGCHDQANLSMEQTATDKMQGGGTCCRSAGGCSTVACSASAVCALPGACSLRSGSGCCKLAGGCACPPAASCICKAACRSLLQASGQPGRRLPTTPQVSQKQFSVRGYTVSCLPHTQRRQKPEGMLQARMGSHVSAPSTQITQGTHHTEKCKACSPQGNAFLACLQDRAA